MPAHDTWLERARALHARCVVLDAHIDTTQKLLRDDWNLAERHDTGHVDLPRLRQGGVSAAFFAVYHGGPLPAGEGVMHARAQLRRLRQTAARYPHELLLARCSEDVRAAHAEGRVAMLLAIEGGYLIEDSLEVLREFHAAGARYLTLTHGFHTSWADSAGIHEELEPRHGGLTSFGRDVVRELNRLGMMVDVSHVSDATVRDVLETSCAPVVATHSSCRAVSPHRRNLSDELMRAIAKRGGVVHMNFSARFIDPAHPPIEPGRGAKGSTRPTDHVTPLAVLVDHFEHALQTIGPDHVGIGSDFDGVPTVPAGMSDCAHLPNLTAALLQRNYSESDIAKVLGANTLRVMEACAGLTEGGAPSA